MNVQTEQENFWAGEFGDEYIQRNKSKKLIAANIALFSGILRHKNVKSVIEFGSSIGLNLVAIKTLLPDIKLGAIEINQKAVKELEKIEEVKIYNQSILDFNVDYKYDLVLSKGVLIHIEPDMLNKIYHLMYEACKKYICIVEYYNPVPVELTYRGHNNKLFKRDFAGEMLDKFPDLTLCDYGFTYHRDINFPQDDTNWFLLEKK
jgi:spore coat polysaccharide biosynthesis protein SpsF